MVRAETVMLQCANKIILSSTEESSLFFFISSSIQSISASNCRMTSFGFRHLRDHSALGQNKLLHVFRKTQINV